MKKIKKILKNPMILVLVVILLLFTPQGLYSPGQSRNVGVVVALGIDGAKEGYEVSLLTYIPKSNQTFEEGDSVVSGRGNSIAKALYNAQIALGRRVGLSHVKTTVLSEPLLSQDVTQIVDYLTRLAALSSSTVFIGTNSSAKELLTLSSSLQDEIGLDIEQVIGFNSDKIFVSETSLEEFYRGYYGRERASIIGFLPVVDSEGLKQADVLPEGELPSNPSDGTSESQPGGSQGQLQDKNSSQTSGKKKIINTAQSVLFKDGKKVAMLSLDQVNSVNLINQKSKGQIVRVENAILDGHEHTITYRVREKKVRSTTFFENGYPVYEANITLGMELMEIEGDHRDLRVWSEFTKLTPEIIAKIDSRLKKDFKDVLEILRKNKADVLGVGNRFFAQNRALYNRYIQGIEGEDSFIQHVIFRLNFTIEPN